MFSKTVIATLALGFSFFVQADLQNIGHFTANGTYQPGYANYSHARERSSGVASEPLSINHQARTGAIEPNYVNYPIQTRTHRTATSGDQLSKIGNYKNGIYEPGYLNHQHIRN
ncbi:hypothetical protein [Photobacterium kagoshimensis]|uniref:hypothetical protein n=1 Tax=Photobacterium kagoshimensis TaxID=2910242 RepID=UPI003D0C5C29